jgi:hypothetical protein
MSQHRRWCARKKGICWCCPHAGHLRQTAQHMNPAARDGGSALLLPGHLRDALLVPQQLPQPVHRCAGPAALDVCRHSARDR